MRVNRARRAALIGVLAATTAVLAGCGEEGQPSGIANTSAPASPTSTASESPTTTKAPKTTTKPAPSSTQAPAQNAGLCTSADLKLSLSDGEGAAGTIWRSLRFTNKSSAPCEIQGFPGVSYVAGDDGHQVGAAAYRDGSKGAAVTLAPGETAYAAVGFAQVGNYDPEQCRPTEVRGLRVYPPQETRSMFVPSAGQGCANENIPGDQLKVQTIKPGSGPA